MWLLFIVVILTGSTGASESKSQIARFTNFNTESECVVAKIDLMKQLTDKYPSSEISLTCAELSPFGQPT